MRGFLGRLLQRLAVPGFVRETEYHASIAEVSVQVRTGARSTVVTVNGVEVYFERASGAIEGVGFAVGHRWRVARRAGRLAASVWQ